MYAHNWMWNKTGVYHNIITGFNRAWLRKISLDKPHHECKYDVWSQLNRQFGWNRLKTHQPIKRKGTAHHRPVGCQTDEWFVWKCSEIAGPISSLETAATCEKLTHWCWMTHIYIDNLTIIGSGNGLSPGRRQAIIRTNAGILSTGLLGTNLSESLIEILAFSFMEMRFCHFVWASMC